MNNQNQQNQQNQNNENQQNQIQNPNLLTNNDKFGFAMLGLSLTIVRNKQGKYLSVNEVRDRGWWIPGGRVDPPEDFFTAAKRECKEEAGIDVNLKGILRINQSLSQYGVIRMKVIFYAEPVDENQPLKSVPDEESLEARWTSVQEFKDLCSTKGNKARGSELVEFGNYIDNGGNIYPLSALSEMSDQNNEFKGLVQKDQVYIQKEFDKSKEDSINQIKKENKIIQEQIQKLIENKKLQINKK